MILLGVIHIVRTLRGGKGGPAKSVLARIEGRGSFGCKRTYAIVFFSQFRKKVQLGCRGSYWCFEWTFSDSLA